jgi:hypothetical protein
MDDYERAVILHEQTAAERQAQLSELQMLRDRVAQFEKLAGIYAELLMANHVLEDRAVLLLGGLIEITKIKGNPPIQVARTIASRVIDACKEEATANEPEVTQ